MSLNFLLTIIIIPFLLLRWFRWLAIVQQKEYRLDRIELFLKTSEGKKELITFWPFRGLHLALDQIKRPVRTMRIKIISLLSLVIISLTFLLPGKLWLHLFLLMLFLPAVVITATFPTTIISEIITWTTLKKAQRKLQDKNPIIIGITGSYGKTSTKQLLAHVLAKKFSVFATPQSFNTRYSVAKSILKNYKNQEIAILEYGAYTKHEISYLTKWFQPNLAIITGITQQHLGLFGNLQTIIQAKSELLDALPDDGVVFCNGADSNVKKICQEKKQTIISYSEGSDLIKLEKIQLNKQGQLFLKWKEKTIKTKLVGKHYQQTIQAVIAVATHSGMNSTQITKALSSFKPSDKFIQSKQLKNGSIIINDGQTANPKGFDAAILLARSFSNPHKILLTSGIIDLLNQSQSIHKILAQKSKNTFLEVLYTGIDGREEFEKIFGKKCITEIDEIKKRLKQLPKDSLLLIEGRISKGILEEL